jgi:hypothetical protein
VRNISEGIEKLENLLPKTDLKINGEYLDKK